MASEPVSRWASWRDFFAATRELMIVVAVALLLIAPASVRGILERAGIRSVAGIEFDIDAIAESQVALEAAEKELALVRDQLASVRQAVGRPAATPSNTPRSSAAPQRRLDPADQVVSKLLDQMEVGVDQALGDVVEAKSTNDNVVDQVERLGEGKSYREAVDRARERRPDLRPNLGLLKNMKTIHQPETDHRLGQPNRLGLKPIPVGAALER